MHHAVLLKEVIEGLSIKPGGLYIDATFGQGGHAREILKRGGKVLGIDWDINQIQKLKVKYQNYKNLKLVVGNFAEIEKIAKENNFFPVDGILFDLGLSMEQIENSGRGFSYRKMNEPLDMRIDTDYEFNAEELVNSSDLKKLYEILARNSEEINSLAISQSIVRTRTLKRIKTVGDLIKIIDKTLGFKSQKTYARVFQALRIEVNDEINNLKKGLEGVLKISKIGGKIAIISFHSLEDRVVKQFIRKNILKQVNKKIIGGKGYKSFERSAKLRIIEI